MQAPAEVTQEALDRLVARVVEAVRPLRIVLFGSQARGTAGRSSDFDLLVVVPEGTPLRETARTLYRDIPCEGHSADYVVATPSLLERHRDNVGLIYRTILEEGREVYAAR